MRLIIFFIIIQSILTQGCKPDAPELQPLDLLTHGLPLKINAPVDVEITSSDLGIMKDVTVKNESGYSIQIFESATSQLSAANILEDLKNEIKDSKFFSRLMLEEERGFIFEKKVDENYINYDFRHVKVRGDKQYVIQVGLSNQYTLAQVEVMYQSVQ